MNKLVFFFLILVTTNVTAAVQWVDRIIAIAGNDVVTQLELQREGMQVQRELKSRNTPLPANDVFIRQVLERLIVRKIQLQRANDLGIRVSDVQVNKAIEKIAAENRLNLSQFRLAMQSQGMDYDVFRNDIRNELLINQLRQREVDRGIKISQQEVDDFLAKQKLAGANNRAYRISHILIATPEAASPEQIQAARSEAESLRQRVQQGEDFSQLAVAHSDGQTALEGGDLGWRENSQLPTIFADAIRDLKTGQVSELIRSPSGFHLVKLVEAKAGTDTSIREVRARHILIAGTDARLKIEELARQLVEGADFAGMAKAHSLDKGSAPNGGDLGWAAAGKYVPEFEAMLNRLQPGQVSKPFQTQFGWHIVELLDQRSAPVSNELLQVKAREFLFKQKQEEAELLWLRRLRDEAYVDYRLPELKTEG